MSSKRTIYGLGHNDETMFWLIYYFNSWQIATTWGELHKESAFM